jgi:CRISPR-associated protein Cmr3
MATWLTLTCRDPLVSRDGRPFGDKQGYRMRSAGWLLPSVVAGSLRSLIGKAAGRAFSTETAQELLGVEVAGAFPVADGKLYLPAPHDCVVCRQRGPLRTAPRVIEQGGCDFPDDGLQPVSLSEDQAPGNFKPDEGPAWWPVDRYAAWLAGDAGFAFDDRFLRAPQVEARTHVRIDEMAGAASDGELFTTVALPLTHLGRHGARPESRFSERFAEINLDVRVRADQWCGTAVGAADTLHPLGGERRLVHWKAANAAAGWQCPQEVRAALQDATRIRMVLATPAIFRNGWKPGWLNDALVGSPPGSTVSLRLVGASIQRWRAVSGWSLAAHKDQPRGPKPTRRFVPAGGVYFFEIEGGTGASLADRWLEPVSDPEQDQRDGFGLAIWGVW